MAVNNIDLGRIYAAGEQIKGLRNQNKLAEMDMQRTEQVGALLPQAAGGDEGAMQKLTALDPKTAKELMALRGEQRDQARENLESLASLLVSVEKAPPEGKQAAWQRAVQTAKSWGLQTDNVPPQYDPQYARMLGTQFVEMDKLLSGPEAPKTREVKKGNKVITQEWNGQQWVDVGDAPRFSPRQMSAGTGEGGGSLTTAQQRTNAAIDEARRLLDKQGLTHEEIMRVSRRQTDTGRRQEDFNPYIANIVKTATQKKYGADPEFSQTYSKYLTPSPQPEPAPAQPAAPPEPEGPGLLERGYNALFGDEVPGADAPFAATLNGKEIYSNDGQTWFYEDGTPVEQ